MITTSCPVAVRIGGACNGCCQNSAGDGAGGAPCSWNKERIAPCCAVFSGMCSVRKISVVSWYVVMPRGQEDLSAHDSLK